MGWSPSVPTSGKPTLDQPGSPTASPVPVPVGERNCATTVTLVDFRIRGLLFSSWTVAACRPIAIRLRRFSPPDPGNIPHDKQRRGVGIVKTIGLEEHFFTASVVQAWGRLEPQWQNPPGLNARDDLAHRLTDLDTDRFA